MFLHMIGAEWALKRLFKETGVRPQLFVRFHDLWHRSQRPAHAAKYTHRLRRRIWRGSWVNRVGVVYIRKYNNASLTLTHSALGHGIDWDDGAFPVDTVLTHGKRRDRTNPVTLLDAADSGSHRIDGPGRFIAES